MIGGVCCAIASLAKMREWPFPAFALEPQWALAALRREYVEGCGRPRRRLTKTVAECHGLRLCGTPRAQGLNKG